MNLHIGIPLGRLVYHEENKCKDIGCSIYGGCNKVSEANALQIGYNSISAKWSSGIRFSACYSKVTVTGGP